MSTYLITGATGQQGGVTARALLSAGQKVHALVRTPTSPASLALQSLGATLFPGSYTDHDSVVTAAHGCSGVFINVSPSLTGDPGAELRDAQTIIAAAKTAGVKHVIYTSVLKAGQHESFPNWDPESFMGNYWLSKHAIEEAVRKAGFDRWTILKPGTFMTNFLPPSSEMMFPELWSKGGGEVVFKSAYEDSTTISLIDVRDIGGIGAKAFMDGEKWNGREIDIVGEEISVKELVAVLASVRGKEIPMVGFEQGEEEGFRGLIAKSQRFISDIGKTGGFAPDWTGVREMGVKMGGWREFLEGKKERGELEG